MIKMSLRQFLTLLLVTITILSMSQTFGYVVRNPIERVEVPPEVEPVDDYFEGKPPMETDAIVDMSGGEVLDNSDQKRGEYANHRTPDYLMVTDGTVEMIYDDQELIDYELREPKVMTAPVENGSLVVGQQYPSNGTMVPELPIVEQEDWPSLGNISEEQTEEYWVDWAEEMLDDEDEEQRPENSGNRVKRGVKLNETDVPQNKSLVPVKIEKGWQNTTNGTTVTLVPETDFPTTLCNTTACRKDSYLMGPVDYVCLSIILFLCIILGCTLKIVEK